MVAIMVVEFTTICAISAYHQKSCEFEPLSWRDVLDATLCDEVCHVLPTGRRFSWRTPVSSTIKTDRHDITEILLRVALNTITQTLTWNCYYASTLRMTISLPVPSMDYVKLKRSHLYFIFMLLFYFCPWIFHLLEETSYFIYNDDCCFAYYLMFKATLKIII